MKSTKIIYWTTTILFAAMMAFSAIPDILMEPEAVAYIRKLGYPDYFIPFIGYAKLLGCAAILVPSFRTIKEWAYAGLFFDLIGAAYSNIVVEGFQTGMLVMLVFFGMGIASYIYYRKITAA